MSQDAHLTMSDHKTVHLGSYIILWKQHSMKYCVNELSVDGTVYKSEGEILSAWQKHFGALATPADHQDFDEEYKQQVAGEMLDIMDICSSLPAQNSEDCVSAEQVKKALKSMNKGKAADIHGVTVEHFLYGGEALLEKVTGILSTASSDLDGSQRPYP